MIKGKGCSVCFLNSQITTCLSQYLFDLHACRARRHKNKYFYGIMYIFSILLGSLIFFFFFAGEEGALFTRLVPEYNRS